MADKMMKKDLVFESTGKRLEKIETLLPNIPSQRYVIGSVYPGAKEGEEFVFCRPYKEDPVAPMHCVITVDEQGQYWVEDCTDQSNGNAAFKTLVNLEGVKGGEQRLLKSGDIVSLGGPQTLGTACRPRHIFHVVERIIPNPNVQRGENLTEVLDDPNSPLANDLIISEVMSYLPVRDLKNARLVCKKWKAEASKHLEKRGAVFFIFEDDYENSENSTMIFRYLHEMRDMKLQTLQILIDPHSYLRRDFAEDTPRLLFSPGESGEKMMDDLRKLLKSPHNFSTLFLNCNVVNEAEFGPVHLLLQELGGKLVELILDLQSSSVPAVLPPLPLMTNLKKFTHYCGYLNDGQKWVSQFCPLLPQGLEHFASSHLAKPYLQELLKQGTPDLKEIAIGQSLESLRLLLELKNPLTLLELRDSSSAEECFLLERLLWKHAKSLRHLQIQIGNYGPVSDESNINEIRFPSFPKLEGLRIPYLNGARVSWETGLDYKKHFPSLRKLTVGPGLCLTWSKDDPVFNAFFPNNDNGDVRCGTVKDLWVPALPHPEDQFQLEGPVVESFQPRMDRIKEMFPNAVNMNFFQPNCSECDDD